jgi:hypothetical protein
MMGLEPKLCLLMLQPSAKTALRPQRVPSPISENSPQQAARQAVFSAYRKRLMPNAECRLTFPSWQALSSAAIEFET